MQNQTRFFLMCLLLLATSSVARAQSPFGESNQIKIDPPRPVINVPESEPLPIVDPLASANEDALAAHESFEALLAEARAALAAKDFKKTAQLLSQLNKSASDQGTAGGKVEGFNSRMQNGGISPWHVRELLAKASSLNTQMNSRMTAALLEQADAFVGYSTKKGPGKGNVACAWLMSKVLGAAGLVPGGWMEAGALRLTKRMEQEFGWRKVPANAPAKRGSMKTADMKPGDIIYWSPSDHVGIYLGDGMAMSNSSSAAKAHIHPASGYYAGWIPRFVVRPPGAN